MPLIAVLSSYARLLPWREVARLFSVSRNSVVGAVASAVDCPGILLERPMYFDYQGWDGGHCVAGNAP